jgi:hypothetical protein
MREHLAETGRALLPGQIILAGTVRCGLYPVRDATVLSFALTTGSESNAKFYDFAFRLGILVVPSPEAGTATGLDGPSGCPSSSKPRAARQGGGR